MHLSEGLLPLTHAAAWTALVSPLVIDGVRQLRAPAAEDGLIPRRALLTFAGALTFAFTLLPVPIPVAGMSSHMCVTPALALLLGPRRVVVPAALVLLLQALFFAHGGLTTWGANVLTLGVVGPWTAWLVHGLATRSGASGAVAVLLACGLGDVAVYLADAAILGWGLGATSAESATIAAGVAVAIAPAQLPLAAVEAVLSVALLRGLTRRQPLAWPALARALGVVLALFAGLQAAPALAFPALDDVVFQRVAVEAGRHAPGPLLPLEGELALSVFSLGSFVAGVLVARTWQRVVQRDDG